MDSAYADTVRLLLQIAPDVFANEIFAMKGGTAINLFVRDMPRMSVDIDVVYTPWNTPRGQAVADIAAELEEIARRVATLGVSSRKVASGNTGETKLVVENDRSQVKVEVNVVFRGTVLPVQRRPLTPLTSEMFSAALDLPVLAAAELYGSKLVAAMDRQHPRDLFDVWQMFEVDGLTDDVIECFVTYVAGHNRPIHEVLFGNVKDIATEYRNNFVGMTTEPVTLDTLLLARSRLRKELTERLTVNQRKFLLGLSAAKPDWSLLACAHASELPALRWKAENLRVFEKRRPKDFEAHVRALKRGLSV